MKDKKYIIGIVIIVLTFLVALNPYLIIFSAPVFLVGVIVLWFSKKKTTTKLLWTLLPLALWYPSMNLFFYLSGVIGTATAQKLDFIFPNDFTGKVVIVEKIDCGQEVKKIDGREQLIFPDNGILLYQGEMKDGYINHKYYYADKSGRKKEIPSRYNYMFWEDTKDKPSTSEVGVWLEGMGASTTFPPDDLKDYEFMELIVSSKDSLDKFYDFQYNKKFDSTKIEIMKKCR